MLLADLAAAIAWYIAHGVLGHQQTFFAPIAAAITLSTTPVGRALRTVQLVGGVFLGIGVAEGLRAVIATSVLCEGSVPASRGLVSRSKLFRYAGGRSRGCDRSR
jgi:hypothetical protein